MTRGLYHSLFPSDFDWDAAQDMICGTNYALELRNSLPIKTELWSFRQNSRFSVKRYIFRQHG
jgi:hypothetical protein